MVWLETSWEIVRFILHIGSQEKENTPACAVSAEGFGGCHCLPEVVKYPSAIQIMY